MRHRKPTILAALQAVYYFLVQHPYEVYKRLTTPLEMTHEEQSNALRMAKDVLYRYQASAHSANIDPVCYSGLCAASTAIMMKFKVPTDHGSNFLRTMFRVAAKIKLMPNPGGYFFDVARDMPEGSPFREIRRKCLDPRIRFLKRMIREIENAKIYSDE